MKDGIRHQLKISQEGARVSHQNRSSWVATDYLVARYGQLGWWVTQSSPTMAIESELVEVETWARASEQGQHVVSTETNCEDHLYGVEDEGELLLRVSSFLR